MICAIMTHGHIDLVKSDSSILSTNANCEAVATTSLLILSGFALQYFRATRPYSNRAPKQLMTIHLLVVLIWSGITMKPGRTTKATSVKMLTTPKMYQKAACSCQQIKSQTKIIMIAYSVKAFGSKYVPGSGYVTSETRCDELCCRPDCDESTQ